MHMEDGSCFSNGFHHEDSVLSDKNNLKVSMWENTTFMHWFLFLRLNKLLNIIRIFFFLLLWFFYLFWGQRLPFNIYSFLCKFVWCIPSKARAPRKKQFLPVGIQRTLRRCFYPFCIWRFDSEWSKHVGSLTVRWLLDCSSVSRAGSTHSMLE